MEPRLIFTAPTTFKGEDVEVIGKVYDEPIKRNDDVEIHSTIDFLVKGMPVSPTVNFASKLTEHELEIEVKDHASKIDKFIK